ncbi:MULTISPECIES: DUF3949 domain-containing protein [unclassified Bacillus cereus group]
MSFEEEPLHIHMQGNPLCLLSTFVAYTNCEIEKK